MLKTGTGSICAGFMIAAGGSVFLACDSKYAGAVFFSVALLCICYMGYYLYTGKIGYFVTDHSLNNAKTLLVGLIGNLATAFILGKIISYAIPNITEKADSICSAKLLQSFPQTFIRGLFCGILMYLAVSIYKDHKTPLGILFCVPVFILSGFEHSIADMFYFGVSTITDARILLFTLAAVLGNTAGGILLPFLANIGGKADAK
ncbi:MAG: formate/nitrite transporter family protein [Eubacteriales bacterium]|nr:formate/nitrite transporter family protein [Eubacteriales bacterium]